jgi:V/A-type H+-transporting ATPase subunit F
MMDEVDEYTDSRLPAIIPILGKDGTLGIGMTSVKKSVERAVGADILFGGDN